MFDKRFEYLKLDEFYFYSLSICTQYEKKKIKSGCRSSTTSQCSVIIEKKYIQCKLIGDFTIFFLHIFTDIFTAFDYHSEDQLSFEIWSPECNLLLRHTSILLLDLAPYFIIPNMHTYTIICFTTYLIN